MLYSFYMPTLIHSLRFRSPLRIRFPQGAWTQDVHYKTKEGTRSEVSAQSDVTLGGPQLKTSLHDFLFLLK